MSDSEDEASLSLDAVFTEPPRPPTPEPTIATYTRTIHPQGDDWSKINIRLVGSHPLWGHHLWNASRAFATFLETHRALYAHRSVLELGAGGGLPGIVAALNGAANVILTDYPDAALLENLHYNVSQNVPDVAKERIHVEGYIWGHNVAPLFKIQSQNAPTPGFDLIIMSDLVFNHSQQKMPWRGPFRRVMNPRNLFQIHACWYFTPIIAHILPTATWSSSRKQRKGVGYAKKSLRRSSRLCFLTTLGMKKYGQLFMGGS
ncbi:unnamed protein product [Somion occarium]|uniref:Protein N-terminal and lysine N-methyltransferase EFM7 n=1 Tax=Somion occarium TaxID=3059160 RepID=A0ABP1DPY3_9APHY